MEVLDTVFAGPKVTCISTDEAALIAMHERLVARVCCQDSREQKADRLTCKDAVFYYGILKLPSIIFDYLVSASSMTSFDNINIAQEACCWLQTNGSSPTRALAASSCDRTLLSHAVLAETLREQCNTSIVVP